jgi:DNA-binding NtrC family response regulator
VKDGKFREDLFYRLNVYPDRGAAAARPPWRHPASGESPFHGPRRARAAPAHVHGISGALAMLQAYDWPGNIRQLGKRGFPGLSVLCEGELLTEEEFPQISAQVEGLGRSRTDQTAHVANRLPATLRESDAPPGPRPAGAAGLRRAMDERGNVRSLADVELEMIKLAIDHYHGPDERGRTAAGDRALHALPQAQGIRY